MPLHEYECSECKKVGEILFMKASEVTDKLQCPCGGVAKKIMSRNRFKLKDGGVGWADSGYAGQKEPDMTI